MPISGEVCPRHILLTDESLATFDTPSEGESFAADAARFRSIIEGIAEGTLDILCSDHAPHSDLEKTVEFDREPVGITSLETEFSILCDVLAHQRTVINLPKLIEL